MTSQHDNEKRWRPRFSVRALMIVLTLVCLWFGSWEALKRRAVEDAQKDVWLYVIANTGPGPKVAETAVPYVLNDERDNYVWLFGLTIPLTADSFYAFAVLTAIGLGLASLFRRAVREINAVPLRSATISSCPVSETNRDGDGGSGIPSLGSR